MVGVSTIKQSVGYSEGYKKCANDTVYFIASDWCDIGALSYRYFSIRSVARKDNITNKVLTLSGTGAEFAITNKVVDNNIRIFNRNGVNVIKTDQYFIKLKMWDITVKVSQSLIRFKIWDSLITARQSSHQKEHMSQNH